MENQDQVKTANPLKEYMSGLIIFLAILAGVVIYKFILGNPDNFEGGDINNHPKGGNMLGVFYKGGFLVPLALGMLIMLIVFTIERFLTLSKASGKGSMDVFIQQLQLKLEAGDVAGAMAACDEQAGSVGNVMKAALKKYSEMEKNQTLDKEQKVLAIQKSLEEATALELPMLEKNLTIVATLVSVATLVGLIGTVLGMIKAFSALATAGAPDAVALATGISEALINTALGITSSAIATVVYNYFTSRIDVLTYRIDEGGFSIIQTYAELHK